MRPYQRHFQSSDGTDLEIVTYMPASPRAHFILWPCGGGNARAYRVPRAELLEKSVALTLFNPRSHGSSQGMFSFERSYTDLFEFIEKEASQLPVIAVGHSMGAAGMLRAATDSDLFKEVYMAAPICDSRASLFHMYRQGTISEFTDLFLTGGPEDDNLREILADTRWLAADYWHKVRQRLDYRVDTIIHLPSMAEFLENLFIPGHVVWPLLKEQADKKTVRIYLPGHDNWFDHSLTRQEAQKAGVRVVGVPEATDHFMQGGWRSVFNSILNSSDLC